MTKSLIAEKTYRFSVRGVKLYLQLCKEDGSIYDLYRQLLGSGTSVGANVEEAIGGHTEKDFSAKMSIAYKEARETLYWIRLLRDCHCLPEEMAVSLQTDIEEIIRISGAILKTMKRKHQIKSNPNS